MRCTAIATALVAALTSVKAQELDQAYIGQVIAALNEANLTSLAAAAQSVAGTPEGALFLSQLPGSNKTLLAPSNSAFDNVRDEVSNNQTLLANILSMHVLNASITPDDIAQGPAHTIVRSLYNNMMLNSNLTVPVVLYRTNDTDDQDGPGVIIQQAGTNVTTSAYTTAANFNIYVVDAVLDVPPTLGDAATELLPSLANLIQDAELLEPLSMAEGLTVFAPANEAVDSLQDTLSTLNQTQVQGILANHVINGTTVFSTQLGGSGPFISAGGQEFTFTTNDTGSFVTSGNASARILMADVVIQNGVVHVIDNVLVNAEADPEAADQAAESAATETVTETNAVVGPTVTETMGGATSTETVAPGGANAANKLDLGLGPLVGSVAVVLGGLAVGATLL